MKSLGWKTEGNLKYRSYENYDSYKTWQAHKLTVAHSGASRSSKHHYLTLLQWLPNLPLPKPPASVLCLAARLGGEVRGFIESGYFAVGIDLNPGEENNLVVYGDFQYVQYADASLDIIYTNSLDHVFDLSKILLECKRLLKSDGRLLIASKPGLNEPGHKKGKNNRYDCMEWQYHKDLVAAIINNGFDHVHKYYKGGFTPFGDIFKVRNANG